MSRMVVDAADQVVISYYVRSSMGPSLYLAYIAVSEVTSVCIAVDL
jgi:hypothetical protein